LRLVLHAWWVTNTRPTVARADREQKQGLIVRMLDNQSKWLWARTDVDEGDCTDPAIYDEILNVCFRIYDQTTNIGDACVADKYSEDKIHDMQDKYQMDMLDMYRNAWNCTRANPDGGGDFKAADIVYDVAAPGPCFFNLPVIQGAKATDGDPFNCVTNVVNPTAWPPAPAATGS
jgi:hypothetical protein